MLREDRALDEADTRRSSRLSSSRTSVPVMSPGIRSGVNWMRLKREVEDRRDGLRTSSVLASPGAPAMRQCPPAKSAMRIWSMTSRWPTIGLGQLGLDLRPAGGETFRNLWLGGRRRSDGRRRGQRAAPAGRNPLGRRAVAVGMPFSGSSRRQMMLMPSG
jgi:hypothetical protein